MKTFGMVLAAVSLAVAGLAAPVSNTASAQSTKTLKVGIFGGTGPFANLGEGFNIGAKPVFDAFNDSSDDLKIERVQVNVGSYDPTMGLNSIRKAVEVDGVTTMLGAGSPILLAARPYLEEKKVVLFSTAESTALVAEENYLQQIVPLLSDEVNALSDYYCKEKSIKSIAVLALNGAFGDTAVNTVKERMPECGVEVVSVQRYPIPTASFRPQLSAIKQANPDAVYLATIGTAENTSVVVQARQIGIKSKLVGYLASPEGALFEVDAGEGFRYTGFAVSGELPPEVAAENDRIGPLVLYGYNFATVFVETIKALQAEGKEITRESVRTTLLGQKRFETASGTFCFQKDGHTKMPLAVWEVQDGKPVQLDVVPAGKCM